MDEKLLGSSRRMSNDEFCFWDEFPALQLDDPQGRRYNDLVTTLRKVAVQYWEQRANNDVNADKTRAPQI